MTLSARDLVGLPEDLDDARLLHVTDSLGHAQALRDHFGVAACTWPGKRSQWRQAHWEPLYRRHVTMIACASASSRARMEGIASHLAQHGSTVFVALPTGSSGEGPADWCAADVEEARAGIKALRRPWKPVEEPQTRQWTPPDTSTEWCLKNEHYEIFGVEGEYIHLRSGSEPMRLLDTRLASPSKLRMLAPMPWWHRHTGEERITRDTADMIGGMIAVGAKENGSIDGYDLDPDVVGIPGDRVLRLSTGEIRGRTRLDRVMRSLAVEPAEVEPSLWLDTLHAMVGHMGDAEGIIDYLRRWLATSLTTDCSDESVLLFHGQPGAGKSTILDTWCSIGGTYVRDLPGRYLVGSRDSPIRHLIARLRGARIIRVAELPESGRWSASEDFNLLASGETLIADPKNQDAFSFRSVGHLVISANKIPRAHPSSGIFRRLRILQLAPLTRRDPKLKSRLREDEIRSRILGWALESLRDGGLDNPRVRFAPLLTAAREMRESEDILAEWIAKCAVSDPNSLEPIALLHASFIRWLTVHEMGSERDWPVNRFSRQLTQIGRFPSVLQGESRVRCRAGLRLLETT